MGLHTAHITFAKNVSFFWSEIHTTYSIFFGKT